MKVKKSNDIVFQSINYFVFFVFALICVYPFYYIFLYSISDPLEAMKTNIIFLPVGFTLDNYIRVLSLSGIFSAFTISVLRVVLGSALSIFITSMFAYVLTQKEMPIKKFTYRLSIASMYLSSGLIPYYMLMRNLRLNNNFLLYILPSALSVFNMILIKTFMEQMPPALQESAEIDGAGHFTIFFKIIFPLCKPVIAAVLVFCAVGQWNSWFDNYLLVKSKNLQTLQLTLLNYLRESENVARAVMENNGKLDLQNVTKTLTSTSIRMTLTMIVTIPIILVYPFMQKYFIKGILIGAVKG